MSARGRPSSYSEDLAREICDRISSGQSLNRICKDTHVVDRTTVLRWVREDREGFADQYEQALQNRAEHWADEIIDLADEAAKSASSAKVQAAKLRVDARKWVASRMIPRRYGDAAAMRLVGVSQVPERVEISWSSEGEASNAKDG